MNFFDLPTEIIFFVLNKLDMPDLIRSRLVSKNFKYLVDNLKKRKLTIFQDNLLIYEELKVDFDLSNSFKTPLEDFRFFESASFKNFFINIKDLKFFIRKRSATFNLEVLNEFKNLERLLLFHFLSDSNRILDLPALKHLTILNNHVFDIFENNWNQTLYVNTEIKILVKSKVENIELDAHFNIFEFEHPANVLFLRVSVPDRIVNLPEFLNLRTLRLNSYRFDCNNLNLKTITNFKMLENFFIEPYQKKFPESNEFKVVGGFPKVNDLDKGLEAFLKEIIKLRSSNKLNIKNIYFWNIKLVKPIEKYKTDDNKLDKYGTNGFQLKTQLLNYELLSDDLVYEFYLNFNELFDFIDINKKDLFCGLDRHQQIPKLALNFFQKFNNIKWLDVRNLKDENELLSFLKYCKSLMGLKVEDCKFSQNFLDSLPKYLSSSLNALSLIRINEKNNKEFNFDFILKFEYINSLDTTSNLPTEFFLTLFKKCRYFSEIKFNHLGKWLYLQKFYIPRCHLKDDNIQLREYYLSTYDDCPYKKIRYDKYHNFDELVDFFKRKYLSNDIYQCPFIIKTEIEPEKFGFFYGYNRDRYF